MGNITGALKTSNKTDTVSTYDEYKYDAEKNTQILGELLTYSGKTKNTQTVTGSVTVKLNKDANAGVAVGSISNYANVTVAGIEIGKGNAAVTHVVRVNGSIAGNVNNTTDFTSSVVENYTLYKLDGTVESVINEKDGTSVNKRVDTAVGSLKLTYANVTGAVSDYKSVTVKESTIAGAVTLQSNSTTTTTSTFTTKTESDKTKNVVTEDSLTESKATAGGTFTAVDSTIAGIRGYKTVTLTNTSVATLDAWGNITQAGDIVAAQNVTTEAESTLKYGLNGAGTNFDKDNNLQELIGKNETDSKAVGTLTVKVDKKAEADVTVGNISNFANVTLTGTEDYSITAGSIIGGDSKVVTNIDTTEEKVEDQIKIETTEYVSGNLNMSYVTANTVGGFKKVNIKAGTNIINNFVGIDAVDEKHKNAETVTIDKKATVIVKQDMIMQDEDKLTVNGELIFWADKVQKFEENKWVDYDVINGGKADIVGKGKIYVSDTAARAIKKLSDTEVVNLGKTANYFTGEVAELADDFFAVEYNGLGGGWLGDTDDFTDTVDKVRIELSYGDRIYFTGLEANWAGKAADFTGEVFTCTATGTYEFEFKLKENAEGSFNWTVVA